MLEGGMCLPPTVPVSPAATCTGHSMRQGRPVCAGQTTTPAPALVHTLAAVGRTCGSAIKEPIFASHAYPIDLHKLLALCRGEPCGLHVLLLLSAMRDVFCTLSCRGAQPDMFLVSPVSLILAEQHIIYTHCLYVQCPGG